MLADRVFLHFFDIHFLAEKGINSLPVRIEFEMRMATRLSLLCSKELLVPASSYYENSVCEKVLSDFLPLAELGIIVLVGNASSLIEFCYNKIPQYGKGTGQRDAYERGIKDESSFPFKKRHRSSTRDISTEWLSLLGASSIPSILVGTSVPRDIEDRWAKVPLLLEEKAFVVEHVTPLPPI
jgi:hypothetical protein